MSRQKLLLFLLLVVFAGSVVYALIRSPKQQQVPSLKNRPGQAATAVRKKSEPVQQRAADADALHLDRLDRTLSASGGYRRNIFSPIFREEGKPLALKLPPLPPPPSKLPPPPAPAPVPEQAPPPPPPPSQEQLDQAELAKLTFLGFLKKNGEKTVFLSKNNEIILAKKGSKLGSRFEVTEVTDDAITIKSLASNAQSVIPLTENRSLGARQIR